MAENTQSLEHLVKPLRVRLQDLAHPFLVISRWSLAENTQSLEQLVKLLRVCLRPRPSFSSHNEMVSGRKHAKLGTVSQTIACL